LAAQGIRAVAVHRVRITHSMPNGSIGLGRKTVSVQSRTITEQS
jgi:hypothetical protein